MRIDIATLFPEMVMAVLGESIIGRAIKDGKCQVFAHNIRDFAANKHNRVDDTPYGGGMGMVMQAQPIFDCYNAVCQMAGSKPRCVYMSPQGRVMTQSVVREYAADYTHLFLLCGHYEGVDQRVLDEIVDEEISLGDFVLTGGEIAAVAFADSILRLCDGVLSDESCFTQESHWNGLLEHPQYTKPADWQGRQVPQVLLCGHHKNIEIYRRQTSLENTLKKRPDLLQHAPLCEADLQYLSQLREEQ